MWAIKKFFIFLYVNYGFNKIKHGHKLVHNGKQYTHLFNGLFIRRFFSLTVKYIYNVSFINKKNLVVNIKVSNQKYLSKYIHLPHYNMTKKLTWKR
jgi:hypothetical protein